MKSSKWKFFNNYYWCNCRTIKKDDCYYLTICFQKFQSDKLEKLNFKLFNSKPQVELERIRTCELNEFEETNKKTY